MVGIIYFMTIQLSDHFTYKKLFRFTLPSIAMMIFTSIYGVVDGFFISNFVSESAFAAVNFIMPFIMILGAVGFMFGSGGSALIAKTLGEGDSERANKLFSMIVYVSLASGLAIAVLGIIFIRPVASMLGAEGDMLENCVRYARIILAVIPAFMLQMEFQSFFITAEKPQMGFYTTLASGCTNIVLDALLVGVLRLDVEGAAVATAVSQLIGGVVPLFYFAGKNRGLLKLTRPIWDGVAFLKICTNGSSELMSNISMSLVGMLYNVQLLKYAGEEGVSAYGVLMYVSFIFIAVFIGYSIGTAPIVGYNYGSGNIAELKNLFKRSMIIISSLSVVMLVLGEILAVPMSALFVGYNKGLLELTRRAFLIYSFSFLFSGIAIYGSSFFTALNNGPISAAISFLRTVLFQVAAVLLLPLVLDTDGIWLSVVIAEFMAAVVTLIFLAVKRKKYNYF